MSNTDICKRVFCSKQYYVINGSIQISQKYNPPKYKNYIHFIIYFDYDYFLNYYETKSILMNDILLC